YGTGTPTSDDHPGPASLPIHVASCGKHRRVRVMERPSNHRFRGIHERDGVLAVLADRPKVQLNAHSTISTKSTSLCDSAPVRGFGHLRGAPSTSKVWPRHTTFALCVATVPNGANPIYVALDAGRAVKSSEVRGWILQYSTTGPASTHVGFPANPRGRSVTGSPPRPAHVTDRSASLVCPMPLVVPPVGHLHRPTGSRHNRQVADTGSETKVPFLRIRQPQPGLGTDRVRIAANRLLHHPVRVLHCRPRQPVHDLDHHRLQPGGNRLLLDTDHRLSQTLHMLDERLRRVTVRVDVGDVKRRDPHCQLLS